MAYQGMPICCRIAGAGLGITLAASEKKLKQAERTLAEQRRITEGELVQKQAEVEAADLQAKVIGWLPKIAIGVAVLVGGVLVYRRMRRKNPARCRTRSGGRRRRRR